MNCFFTTLNTQPVRQPDRLSHAQSCLASTKAHQNFIGASYTITYYRELKGVCAAPTAGASTPLNLQDKSALVLNVDTTSNPTKDQGNNDSASTVVTFASCDAFSHLVHVDAVQNKVVFPAPLKAATVPQDRLGYEGEPEVYASYASPHGGEEVYAMPASVFARTITLCPPPEKTKQEAKEHRPIHKGPLTQAAPSP